jgi:hypothetical protein
MSISRARYFLAFTLVIFINTFLFLSEVWYFNFTVVKISLRLINLSGHNVRLKILTITMHITVDLQ